MLCISGRTDAPGTRPRTVHLQANRQDPSGVTATDYHVISQTSPHPPPSVNFAHRAAPGELSRPAARCIDFVPFLSDGHGQRTVSQVVINVTTWSLDANLVSAPCACPPSFASGAPTVSGFGWDVTLLGCPLDGVVPSLSGVMDAGNGRRSGSPMSCSPPTDSRCCPAAQRISLSLSLCAVTGGPVALARCLQWSPWALRRCRIGRQCRSPAGWSCVGATKRAQGERGVAVDANMSAVWPR